MRRPDRPRLARRALARAAVRAALVLALGAPPAAGQIAPDAQRGSLLIDQRTEEFALRLRQSQQAHEIERASGGDPAVRREMELLHLQQRQRQADLHRRQLQDYEASGSRRALTDGGAGPEPLPPGITGYARERVEQRLQHDHELRELERSVKPKPPEGAVHYGPTLTEPRPK